MSKQDNNAISYSKKSDLLNSGKRYSCDLQSITFGCSNQLISSLILLECEYANDRHKYQNKGAIIYGCSSKDNAWKELKNFRKLGFNWAVQEYAFSDKPNKQMPTLPKNWVRPCHLIYDHEKNAWCVWRGRERRVENQAWNEYCDEIIKEAEEYYRDKKQGET
tara:strand:- start:10 stop:498 length:489 start_codon:yes stop_codon:yes gene_type:complete